ncbi:MAG: VOC family protein [Pyramidobacter sp.]|nr:VOC family protein [Pyramidobacter sp.]
MTYSLGHIGIRVADMDRALRFYTEALGGEKGREYHMPSGSHLVFVNFADFSVELICKPGDDRTPGRNHLAISVPSIHDAVTRLNKTGFPVPESAIGPMGEHAFNCFLSGPDGEIIELCEGSL